MSKLREQISLYPEIATIKEILEEDKEGACYKEIYSKHGKGCIQDPPGNNCLLLAIATHNAEIAELFIDDAHKKLSNKEFYNFISYRFHDPETGEANCFTNTPLTLAAKYEQYELVQRLLNSGADPNGTDLYGFTTSTILMMQLGLVPSQKNQEIIETIKSLKDKGGVLDQVDKFDRTAFEYLEYDLDNAKINANARINAPGYVGKRLTDFDLAEILQKKGLNHITELGKITYSLGGSSTNITYVDGAICDALKWAGESSNKMQDYMNGRSFKKYDTKEKKSLNFTLKEFLQYQNPDYKKKFWQTNEGENIKEELVSIMESTRLNTLNRCFQEHISNYAVLDTQHNLPQIKDSLWQQLLDLTDSNLKLTENSTKTIIYHVIDNVLYQGSDKKIRERNLTDKEIVERVQDACWQDSKVPIIMRAHIIAKRDGINSTQALAELEQKEQIQNISQTMPNNSALTYAGFKVYKDLDIDMMRHTDYSFPIDAISHEYQELLLGDHDN